MSFMVLNVVIETHVQLYGTVSMDPIQFCSSSTPSHLRGKGQPTRPKELRLRGNTKVTFPREVCTLFKKGKEQRLHWLAKVVTLFP